MEFVRYWNNEHTLCGWLRPDHHEPPGKYNFLSRQFGISFKEEGDGYFHTEELKGVKTFALWPLAQAAESCFGVTEWPAELPAPTSWLEFDVDDVAEASKELQAKGYMLLVTGRQEPWGQTVSRLLSPEGILVGITYTPSLRTN